MTDLPHLPLIYEKLRRGYHFAPDDGEPFNVLRDRFADYEGYFGAIGLRLVRHEREFFYLEAEGSEMRALPKIAVFAYVLIEHYGSQGNPIEAAVMTETHMVSELPHFSLDRYVALLREVEVFGRDGLDQVLDSMQRMGWIRRDDEETFVFLRPFYRIFSKCLELAQIAAAEKVAAETPHAAGDGDAI